MPLRFYTHISALLLAALASTSLLAAEDPGVPSSTFYQAFIGLAVIVGILILAAYLGRKIWGGKGFGQGGLKILGGIALSPRERIVLIEAGEAWLVIGVVPGQIRTLHRMPKGEITDPSVNNPAFAQWLAHFADRRGEST